MQVSKGAISPFLTIHPLEFIHSLIWSVMHQSVTHVNFMLRGKDSEMMTT